jgi:hypothetical protein
MVVGRVRIITSLWRTGDDRTLPLLPYRMDKVELEGVFSEVWELCIASVPCDMQPPAGVGSPSSFLARCGRNPAPRSGMAHTSVCDKGG